MDPFLLLLIAIGLGIPLGAKAIFHHSICWKEWLLQTVMLVAILSGTFLLAKGGMTSDIRILNGEVTQKERDRVSCEHSYQCRCRTVRSGDSTRRECDTCYEHSFDYDWLLRSTVGTVEINRVDRQGLREPARFTQANIGDPVAMRERWTNYVQGAPHSIFNEKIDLESWLEHVPAYPEQVTDYHYVNRVLTTGTVSLNTDQWSMMLANALRPVRDNVVIVVTDITAQDYVSAIERQWLRGNNNDTVVVLVVENDIIIRADAFGWSEDPLLYFELRDALTDTPLDPNTVIPSIISIKQAHFHAHDEDHFAYLSGEVVLPTWAYIALLLLTVALSTGTTWFFHNNETFKR